MIVMKFGGTSVKDAERIRNVYEIVKSRLQKRPVLVCSATSGTTNQLIELANTAFKGEPTEEEIGKIMDRHDQIITSLGMENGILDEIYAEMTELFSRVKDVKLASSQTLDHIQSFGERMSCRIVAAYLDKMGIKAHAHDAYDIGMVTNPDFGKAEPLPHAYDLIKEHIAKMDHVPVVTGFIGKTTAGEITTLTRGGSDYTASIIGAAIDAEEVQIWTDVDGVMTADPRVVDCAKTVEKLSFNEAAELATFGARVLHPKSLIPALKKNIPVLVLNTYDPSGKGTTVVMDSPKSDRIIKAIACKKGISLVNLTSTRMLNAHGYLARVFDIYRDYGKSVDMISTSEVSVSMTINEPDHMDGIIKDLSGIAEVKQEDNKAIICVVGEGMKHAKGIAGRVFTVVGNEKVSIEMISQGASEINISFVVDEKDADKIMIALHRELISCKD